VLGRFEHGFLALGCASGGGSLRYSSRKLGREYKTMAHMVAIYCADQHGGKRNTVCHDCREFLEYAALRLQKCPYGADKPTCANCPVHCYKPARREQARRVMRYAGPRMSFRHPWLAILHLVDGHRTAPPPREYKRRKQGRE